jgi:hypothetical protein
MSSPRDPSRVTKAVYGAALVGYGWMLRHFLGWNWWAAFAVALAGAFVTGLLAEAVRDTWPLEIPYDLSDQVAKLREQGWRPAWVHPWWHCRLTTPHVHMIKPTRPAIARERVVRPEPPHLS